MPAIFHNISIIREKWCDRVIKNVLQIMVHILSSMTYSL